MNVYFIPWSTWVAIDAGSFSSEYNLSCLFQFKDLHMFLISFRKSALPQALQILLKYMYRTLFSYK